jgi:hypothetical protein
MSALLLRRAAALLLLTTPVLAQDPLSNWPREDVEGREEWFWAQRSFPFAERPYGKMSELFRTLSARAIAFSSTNVMPALGGNWRSIGPDGVWVYQIDAGRIAAILPPVTPGGPMYAGTASGGVWRSTNNGISWTPLTDGECGLTTGAMARDPVNSSIVYAATGEGNGGLVGCGVLRSSDGGNVWTTCTGCLRSTGGGNGVFSALVVDQATAGNAASTILIGATNFGNGGIVRSTNSGNNWTAVLSTGPVTSIVAHPSRAGVYYAGNRVTTPVTSRGVYRSTDVGATWTQLPALPVTDPNAMGRIEVAVSKASPGSLWALVGDRNTGGFLGIYRWEEGTNTWTTLASSGVTTAFGTQQNYDLVLAVDPRDPNRIYIAGVTAFRSTDGGATFQRMAINVHADWHVLVFDPNNPDIIWVGTDGGVYLSTDAGDTWTSRNNGMSITQFYPGVSIHPQMTRIAGGTQDNGTHTYSGSLFWEAYSGGDGGYTAINFKDPTIQWGETQWSLSSNTVGNIFRRVGTGGAQRRSTGISTTDRAAFIPPLVMDPVNPTKLYFGTFRLFRTVNDGALWTAISGDLTSGSGVITSVAVSPADTNTIYVGTSDGRAQVSRDGGITFTLATGLPQRSVTRVVAHPTDPLRAIVTVSGFGTPHVYETKDAFATAVTSISGNLIDAPTNVAVYIPSENVILVGTDVGVFQTADGGATWVLGPAGLPNVIIQDLVYQSSTGLLVAGTYGRGMFAYNVGTQSAVLRGDVNGDGRIDAFDALLVQQSLAGAAPASTQVFPRGDANCNGALDAADLVLTLRASVGLPTPGACVGTMR